MNMEGKDSMEGKASVIKETEGVKADVEEAEKTEVSDETQEEDGNSPPRSAGPTSPLSGQHQLCRVCNDAATGNHFGVMSCEACKSFFRRSIRAAARYVCRGSKCCDIDKNTRNRCQHCRLQKCLEVGMNKSAVQEERMPYPTKSRGKLSSERSASPTQQSTPTTPGSVSSTTGVPGMPFPFYALGPTPIHMVNTSFTTDTKTQALSASVMLDILVKAERMENEPKKVFQSPPSTLTYGRIQENARQSLLNVIAWAKEIPMFTRLSVEDQIKLIKRSWNELITLKLVYRNVKFPTGKGITFHTGEVAQFYQSDDPMVVSFLQKVTKECIATMQDIQLDETELSCLKLISLMNPFIHNLTPCGQKEIEHTQDAGLELLEVHIKQSKPSSPRRMAKLLLFLGQLKALSKDIIAHIEAQQTLGFENDAVLLELISDND
ncbi:retinoic acid receptor RXR-alpha-B-like isoform X2 [Dysidea avara]|uniref:retinoic acid receptor RXR-alpha-B-like isoform X2 n=1 Tax=Dysidea avara TaxID=196820 RepID=UPI003329FAAE